MYYITLLIICIIFIVILTFINFFNTNEAFTNDPKQICSSLGYTYLDNNNSRNPQCVFTSDELISRCGINHADPNGIFPKCSSGTDNKQIVNDTITSKSDIYNDCPSGYIFNPQLSSIHTKVCSRKVTTKHSDSCRSNKIFSADLDISGYERTNVNPYENIFRSCDIQCDPKTEYLTYDKGSGKMICKRKEKVLRRLRDKSRLNILGLDKIIKTAYILDDLDNTAEYRIQLFQGKIIDHQNDIQLTTVKNKANIILFQNLYDNIFSSQSRYNTDFNKNIPISLKDLNTNIEVPLFLNIDKFNKGLFAVFHTPSHLSTHREIVDKLNNHLNLKDVLADKINKLINEDMLKYFGDLKYSYKTKKEIQGKLSQTEIEEKISQFSGRFRRRRCGKICRRRRKRKLNSQLSTLINSCVKMTRDCFETINVNQIEENKKQIVKDILLSINRDIVTSAIDQYTREYQNYESIDSIITDYVSKLKVKYNEKHRELVEKMSIQSCENIRNINGC